MSDIDTEEVAAPACEESKFHDEYWVRVYEDISRMARYGDQPLEDRRKAFADAEKWLVAREKHLETCDGGAARLLGE